MYISSGAKEMTDSPINNTLKPCKFCGSDAQVDPATLDAYCLGCAVHTEDYETAEQAATAWNEGKYDNQ